MTRTRSTQSKETYKGLEMHCSPGLHAAAAALLQRTGAPRTVVLDLGAGSGAFLARLRDDGFDDLHAVELDIDNFRAHGIDVVSLDLNSDFAQGFSRRFNLITAIEVIEHLDSPRQFLRQVHCLLQEQGMLLLSTPNVTSWIGRIKFLLTGELRFFDPRLYHTMRHISPITDVQMRLMLRETGFAVAASVSAGDLRSTRARLLTAPLNPLFRLAWGPTARGDVNLYIARKTEPERRSPGSTSNYSAARRAGFSASTRSGATTRRRWRRAPR